MVSTFKKYFNRREANDVIYVYCVYRIGVGNSVLQLSYYYVEGNRIKIHKGREGGGEGRGGEGGGVFLIHDGRSKKENYK